MWIVLHRVGLDTSVHWAGLNVGIPSTELYQGAVSGCDRGKLVSILGVHVCSRSWDRVDGRMAREGLERKVGQRENDDRKRETIDDGLRVFTHDMVWMLRV